MKIALSFWCFCTIWYSFYQDRSVSRFGDDSTPASRVASAKLLSSLLISLTGTMYIYQGQELGSINVKNWSVNDYEDVEVRNNYRILCDKFGEDSPEVSRFKNALPVISRDNARTPIPWTSKGPTGGFSDSAEPWFKMNEVYKEGINVEDELNDRSASNRWAHLESFLQPYSVHLCPLPLFLT